jgi:cytochrome c oxidase cbb3-type subunit 3
MAAHGKHVDPVTGMETTGHEWDGIRELNTPLPRWWLWVFYATIVWSVLYWIAFPAWPLISSYTAGVLGYSTRDSVRQELAQLHASRQARAAGLAEASLDQIRSDPALRAFAVAQGRAAFGDNCAPCHGSGGAGSPGYPNLNDDDWIWGGQLADIQQTIRHGIRYTQDSDTRISQMPAFGRDGILDRQQIADTAAFVLTLAGRPAEGGNAEKGRALFAENCAACHGDAGKGNRELGAPNLTDGISLFGNTRAAIVDTITNSRGGVMPAWAGRLDPVTIKSLTVYVHGLGGGQ